MKSRVAVLKTTPNTVLEDYNQLMHLAEYQKALPKSNELILKLNLSWSLYFPACSTEPWQLEGVLRTLKDDSYKKIYPVENRTVVTSVEKGAKLNRWNPVFEKYGVLLVDLTKVKWVSYKPKHDMLALYDVFPEGIRVPKMFLGRNVLHLPTMKTHGHTTITGSMKNAFGGLITKKRHHAHKDIHKVLVDLLQIQKEIHPGIFAVMDGTVCGDGAGPRCMIPKIKNYILASSDSVAIDAISAKMMGFEPLSIPFIKIAHDKGLGCGDIKQIEIIGENISDVNFKFKTKKSLVVFMDQTLRKKYPLFEPILFHTPLFKMCILGSAVYHDRFWYPLIGKWRIKKFMNTEWGKLFQKY